MSPIMGYAVNTTLRVRNNTTDTISKVMFFYNSNSFSVNLKKIKSNENKQTGISSIYDVKNLCMKIEGLDKTYTIKDFIPGGNISTIIININSLDNNHCEFSIAEEVL